MNAVVEIQETPRQTVKRLLVDYWYPYLCRPLHRKDLDVSPQPMFDIVLPDAGNVHDDGDADDALIARVVGAAIEKCVDELPTVLMRISVEVNTANRAGAKVWRNARYTPEELYGAWQEALGMLEKSFARDGLMKTVAHSEQPMYIGPRGSVPAI